MHQIGRYLLAAALLAGVAGTAGAGEPVAAPHASVPEAVQRHIDLAYRIAGGDVSRRNLPGLLYLVDDKTFPAPVPVARRMPTLPAAKVFDQFYYLGLNWVNAWALDTPDGIVLFDTLTSPAEAAQCIEGGLRSVGLDPARIRYIVLTHGHADHFGGAKYLQDKYHARVVTSDIDWAAMTSPVKPWPATVPERPTRDMTIGDGQTLTLGGTTIRFTLTPGHTPGTLSMLIPVTDHGRPHVISFVGGTGLNQATDPAAAAKTLEASLTRFARISRAANADVLISSHPFNDDAWDKAKLIEDGGAGRANPFVATPDAVARYYASTIEGARAIGAYNDAKTPRS